MLATSCEEPGLELEQGALLTTPSRFQDPSLCLRTALRCPRGCATVRSGSLPCGGHAQSVAGIKMPCGNDGDEGVTSRLMSKRWG